MEAIKRVLTHIKNIITNFEEERKPNMVEAIFVKAHNSYIVVFFQGELHGYPVDKCLFNPKDKQNAEVVVVDKRHLYDIFLNQKK
jgi:hypothetical protein